jgi:RNA-directed DNA polymerase
VDADLSKYFDTIPHRELMQSVARRVSDGKMLRLIKMWLTAPAEETDDRGHTLRTGGERSREGTPQGGVISPLLANVYIHRLLKTWKKFGLERHLGARIINYADDLVILCRDRSGAETALKSLRWIVERLGLRLNEQKTHLRDALDEPFDFLGYTFGPMVTRRTGARYMGVTPSMIRVKRFRQSLRLVPRPANQGHAKAVVAEVNRRLVGWANYFRVGTLSAIYRALDEYTCMLLRSFLVRRHKVPGRGTRRFPDQWLRAELGLVQLSGRRRVALSHALK